MARDMTQSQYDEALKRNGFRSEFGMAIRDEREGYSVMTALTSFNKFSRRTRLAYLLQNRAQHVAGRDKARKAKIAQMRQFAAVVGFDPAPFIDTL